MRTTGRLERHHVQVQTMPAWVDADPTRVEQIISNLIGNALKYTPAGGSIAVDVIPQRRRSAVPGRQRHRHRHAGRTGDARIRRACQGSDALDRSQGGLGIGLALVRQLVCCTAARWKPPAPARTWAALSACGCLGRRRYKAAFPQNDSFDSSPRQPVLTPCVAVCSTLFDDVCRGCGRTVLEVANWVFMTQEEKDAVWERIHAGRVSEEEG